MESNCSVLHDVTDKRWKGRKCFYWIRMIFSDRDTRSIFCFLCLNLSFAFVELAYGFWTNSLSLVSDAFHMFFDCSALITGLIASIIAKWEANARYSYGYVRAEVLGGFVNAIMLVFVAFFVLSEAIERLAEPPEIKHERLFVVSVLGFLVNLTGIVAFNHGGIHHGHSHGKVGGRGHGHSHNSIGGHEHSHNNIKGHSHSHNMSVDRADLHYPPELRGVQRYPNTVNSNYSIIPVDCANAPSYVNTQLYHPIPDEGDNVIRHNRILEGVFLHVLADTLGSVGVIVSSLLIRYFNLMIADPICSICISGLILVSVVPLLRDTLGIMMMRTPKELENILPTCFKKVANLPGVRSLQDPHFWTLSSDHYVGSLELLVDENADLKYILFNTQSIFNSIGVRKVTVQIDNFR